MNEQKVKTGFYVSQKGAKTSVIAVSENGYVTYLIDGRCLTETIEEFSSEENGVPRFEYFGQIWSEKMFEEFQNSTKERNK